MPAGPGRRCHTDPHQPVGSNRADLAKRDRRNWDPREVDGKHTSHLGEGAGIDPALVCFSAPPTERQAKAEPRSIDASLLERAEQVVDVSTRETTARIFDLEQYALGTGAHS